MAMILSSLSQRRSAVLFAAVLLLSLLIWLVAWNPGGEGGGLDVTGESIPGSAHKLHISSAGSLSVPSEVRRRKEEPFTLSADFHPSFQPWRPVANLSIRDEVAEGLRLTPEEFAKLKVAFERLVETSARIQSEDALVADGKKSGEQVIYLIPVPAKWGGVQSAFENELKSAIGESKALYFLETSRNELNLITGDYGTLPRGIYLRDWRPVKEEEPPDLRSGIPDWTYRVESGSAVAGDFSTFFPSELRSSFGSQGTYQIGWTAEQKFTGDPPPFLQPLIESSP